MVNLETYLNITIRVAKATAEAQLKQFQGTWKQVQASLNSSGGTGAAAGIAGTSKSLASLTSSLRSAGYAMTATFTAPLVLAGKKIYDFTQANEAAFAELQKVYGSDPFANYGKDLDALRKNFEALSNEYGIQQAEVIGVGAAWAQAGVQGAALAQSVDTTLKAMVIGGLSATQATNALIAIQAQYGASSSDLVKILNTLNVVENQTGISMAGLIDGFQRAAGAASEAGINYRELAAMLAALTPAAGTASQAGNALKTIISNILAPTKNAEDILAKMGVTVSDMSWKSATGAQRIELLATKFHGLDQAQKNVASRYLATNFQINRFDILMRDVYNSLVKGSGGLSYYGKALDATRDANVNAKVAAQELQTVLNSSPHQMQQIGVIIQNSLVDVLKPLLPVILAMASYLAKLAMWFSNLSPTTQKFIGLLAIMLALMGPLMLYVSALVGGFRSLGVIFGLMFGPFGKIVGLFTGLFTTLGSGGIAIISALGSVLGSVFSPIVGILRAGLGAAGSVVAVAARTMFVPLTAAAGAAGTLLTRTFGTTFAILGGIVSGAGNALLGSFTLLFSGIRSIGFGALAFIPRIFSAAFSGAGTVVKLGFTTIGASFFNFFRSIPRLGFSFLVELGALFGRLPSLVLTGLRGLLPMMASFGTLLLRVFTGPWGIAITVVVSLLYGFRDKIAAAWQGIVGWFNSGASGLSSALGGIATLFDKAVAFVINVFNMLPQGVQNAMMAVVHIVSNAAKAVYELFSYLNPFAHHSPSLVENVTAGMAEVNKQFATVMNISGPILKAYADIQTFSGAVAGLAATSRNINMAKDLDNLKKAGAGSGAINAYKVLNSDLTALTAKQNALNAVIRIQKSIVDADQEALNRANDALDRQQAILDKLTATQQHYSDLMSTAKQNISDLANTQIVGQKAMGDQIFANTQAQKALQLQMLQMEDVIGPIGDVQSKLAALNGEILTLQGTQQALQQAGAGSDILSVYNDQITALQGQTDQINSTVDAYNALQKQLDDLQRKGQELDLMNSLQFDGLTKQINDAANAMKELPFNEIMAGIAANRANLDKYTAAYDKATKAVDAQQKVVDAAKAARDRIQATYDVENKKLQTLQDAYTKVNDAIQEINNSLQTMGQAAQAAIDKASSAAKEGQAAKNFDAAAGGNYPTGNLGANLGSGNAGGLSIDDLTKAAIENTRKAFGKLDLLTPIKKKWGQVVSWWNANVGPGLSQFAHGVGQALSNIDVGKMFSTLTNSGVGKFLVDLGKTLGTIASAFGKLFAPEVVAFLKNIVFYFKELGDHVAPKVLPFLQAVWRLLGLLWAASKPLLAVMGILLLGAIKVLASVFNSVLGPAIKTTATITGNLLQIITGILNFIVDIFTGKWKKAWNDVVEVVKGIFSAIGNIIRGAWNLIWGAIEGLVNGIVHFFQWLWDTLVGHSIIPDMIMDIVEWFAKLPVLILQKLASAITWLLQKGKDIVQGLWNGAKAVWSNVYAWLGQVALAIIAKFVNAINWLVKGGRAVLGGLWNGAKAVWSSVSTWLSSVGTAIVGKFGNAINWLVGAGKNVLNGLWNGAKNVWNSVTGWFGRIGTGIKAAFSGAGNWLISAGKSIISGLLKGLSNAGGVVSAAAGIASQVAHAIVNKIIDGVNAVIPHRISVEMPFPPHKKFSVPLLPNIPHWNALGGIYNRATVVGVGEAGKEVILPLTNPARAWDLVKRSGLLNVIGGYLGRMNTPNLTTLNARVNNASGGSTAPVVYQNNTDHTELHFHGDLSFPNIKSGNDAESFIRNLESLTGKL